MVTIQKVARFEKVSFPQYYESMKAERPRLAANSDLFFQTVNHEYEKLTLPARATAGSAGYDFRAPFSFRLEPGEVIKFPTGIRAIIDNGWFLMCVPRSGLGFKYRLRLANTLGIIDADYAQSDNEGNIYAKLVNEGDRPVEVKIGDAFMQGIFLPFGVTYDDAANGVRNGGFGSTGS